MDAIPFMPEQFSLDEITSKLSIDNRLHLPTLINGVTRAYW